MAAYSTETVHVKAGFFKDADDMVPKKLQPKKTDTPLKVPNHSPSSKKFVIKSSCAAYFLDLPLQVPTKSYERFYFRGYPSITCPDKTP